VDAEILTSALKHGVTVDQIRSVLRTPFRIIHGDDDLTLVIGPDGTAALFEVIVAFDEEETRVIHAMPLRPKFYRML
jgi:hypothetical protein